MAQKQKIALVLPYFGQGGAEKMVSQLACSLNATQFHVEVFCVYGKPQGNFLEQNLIESGIPIHFIRKPKGMSLTAIGRLFRELDRFSPDVVHTHLYACVYAALWPIVRRKPFLHTFHTLPEVENRRLIRRLLTKTLIGMKKMIPIAISGENQRLISQYYGIPAEAVPVVHNPVNINRFSSKAGTRDGVFRFITAGRFSVVKNQKMMYQAFFEFLKKGYDARLTMLGSGEEAENLKCLAEELDISDRIDYAGFVENVEDYLTKADVFLLSSDYEALPLALLEAMAAGLPIVATDVGGVRDIVTDNGILVPAKDACAMAQAMEMLYQDDLLRRNMSQKAMNHVAAFDISNTAAGYSEVYRRYTVK